MKIQINLGNYRVGLQANIRKIRKDFVAGYCNRCKDGRYVVFLDYDRMDFSWIKSEIEWLQERFMLGDFYVFESSHDSYHCVCFDKLSLQDYLEVLKNSSVDTAYITVPLHFGRRIWALRMSDKKGQPISYVGVIKSKRTAKFYDQSTAHAKLLNTLFKLNVKLEYPDNNKELILARYPI